MLPRSLWLQTILLLALALALTALVAARPLHSHFQNHFAAELDIRGRNTIKTLAKDYELRPAITLKDATQATPILRGIAAADEDILYVAILKGEELIAAAPASIAPDLLRQSIALHFAAGQGQSSEVLRFTQEIMPENTLAFMGGDSLDSGKGKDERGYVVLGLSTRKTHSSALQQTLFSIGTSSLVVFTLLILFYFRWVAQRLSSMVGFAQRAAAGDLQKTLNDPVADDIGRLAAALQRSSLELHKANSELELQVMLRTGELQKTLAELWSEMDLARKIQTVLLPPAQVFAQRYEFAGTMKPADEIGGDYFDAVEAGGKLWLLIGDVSGHGVSAGLIMMMVQTAVRTLVHSFADAKLTLAPSKLLTLVNRSVWSNLQLIGKGQYMTMSALCIADRRLIYAGLHQSALLFRRSTQQVEELENRGAWLGLLDEIEGLNEDTSTDFGPGDSLLLYTDGLIESRRGADDDSLLEIGPVVSRYQRECRARSSAEHIARSVLSLTERGIVRDDVSVVALRYLESMLAPSVAPTDREKKEV
jgi:serine phosphatase RsbU (regulator of sigma subunit)